MKAVYFDRCGGPEVLRHGERPDPVAREGEAVVRVRACGINHLDLWVRAGLPGLEPEMPHILGNDVVGEIVAVGPGVTHVTVGDRTLVNPALSCGVCTACATGDNHLCRSYDVLGRRRNGGYAELVSVPAVNCLPFPGSLSWEEAAAVPLVFLTAWHMLVTRAHVAPGEDVLVIGAGSGVGSAAIQIARLIGARVMTTVGSDDKIEFAKSLGAERVVNYRTQDFVEEAKTWTAKRGVDVVIEHIGGETLERSTYALTRLGTLVSIGSHDTHWGRLDLRHVYSKNLKIVGTNLGSILELRTILDYVADGRLKPVVDRAFPLKDARAAVQHVLDRKNKGKVLVIP